MFFFISSKKNPSSISEQYSFTVIYMRRGKNLCIELIFVAEYKLAVPKSGQVSLLAIFADFEAIKGTLCCLTVRE